MTEPTTEAGRRLLAMASPFSRGAYESITLKAGRWPSAIAAIEAEARASLPQPRGESVPRRHASASMTPYYSDDLVTLYLADAREWMPEADVIVTDPPYGRAWKQGELDGRPNGHRGIAGDSDTSVRDAVLSSWGSGPAIVFGDLMLPPPDGTRQVLVYRKPPNAGTRGAMGGWRRDAEAIYLLGPWSSGLGGRSSIIATRTPSQGNPSSPQGKYRHPHAKPVDVMLELVGATTGTVLDPFAGSGSTLVAARLLGRRAIGIEIDERYCEMAARRCSQEVLGLGA